MLRIVKNSNNSGYIAGIDQVKTGMNMRAILKKNGVSVNELAERLCVSRQAVYSWLSGENLPDHNNILSFSLMFNVPINDIYVYYIVA